MGVALLAKLLNNDFCVTPQLDKKVTQYVFYRKTSILGLLYNSITVFLGRGIVNLDMLISTCSSRRACVLSRSQFLGDANAQATKNPHKKHGCTPTYY